ncbi:uncharacterized protein FOMMEDRAFT_156593 [Fomitiporia mediterranea MF3/22]|uniref:uncharacterized protein n=1 Tax=Fomitiporia mediterranea (strain MF3/22) TaxID=694068 RepID=UPI0004409C08|nr:uncharacterized protein FOMMEDRAFT_156593 [Fomitiporia mediterranea MF3/22]EJD03207.1 hypothetical protein FOMMEDRAFT_156593 [Fomitiporia mediterranea MF3/22]
MEGIRSLSNRAGTSFSGMSTVLFIFYLMDCLRSIGSIILSSSLSYVGLGLGSKHLACVRDTGAWGAVADQPAFYKSDALPVEAQRITLLSDSSLPPPVHCAMKGKPHMADIQLCSAQVPLPLERPSELGPFRWDNFNEVGRPNPFPPKSLDFRSSNILLVNIWMYFHSAMSYECERHDRLLATRDIQVCRFYPLLANRAVRSILNSASTIPTPRDRFNSGSDLNVPPHEYRAMLEPAEPSLPLSDHASLTPRKNLGGSSQDFQPRDIKRGSGIVCLGLNNGSLRGQNKVVDGLVSNAN